MQLHLPQRGNQLLDREPVTYRAELKIRPLNRLIESLHFRCNLDLHNSGYAARMPTHFTQ